MLCFLQSIIFGYNKITDFFYETYFPLCLCFGHWERVFFKAVHDIYVFNHLTAKLDEEFYKVFNRNLRTTGVRSVG
jgi:hypothetical protein